jgi:mRNA interferase MazF
VPDFDGWLETRDPDFLDSGLLVSSVIRLGFLAILPKTRIIGIIGHVSADRHDALLHRLSDYLVSRRI